MANAKKVIKRKYAKFWNPFGENKDQLCQEVIRIKNKEETEDISPTVKTPTGNGISFQETPKAPVPPSSEV